MCSQNDSIIFSITKPLCYGNCNGSITASVSGTNAPYSFLWSNGATTNSITGLCVNDYTLSVTNNNSVTTTSVATLSQPPPLIVNQNWYCGLDCYMQTGFGATVCINPTGGTLPYLYDVIDINGTSLYTTVNGNFSCFGAAQGAYNIIMTDSNSCQAFLYGNFIVLDSTNCYTTFSSPTCSTCCDGMVQLNFNNPCPSCVTTLEQAGVTYTSSTHTFTNVCLGSYTITATNFGCPSVFIDTLSRPTYIRESDNYIKITLFPNPTNGIIKINTNNDHYKLAVINTIGMIVSETIINNSDRVTIDISDLPKGIYIFQFKNKSNQVVTHKKIILE
ncbi:MAG: T9SS type A sorting domain-containing protein [Burkholderiales bacterium]|nr:T9SS type A sorting domain-containing protein [Bacteroidia bacterium]